MNLFPKKTILKSEFADLLNISYSTFARVLLRHESRIREIFPEYERRSSLLYPIVIDYFFKEYGLTWEYYYSFSDKAKARKQ